MESTFLSSFADFVAENQLPKLDFLRKTISFWKHCKGSLIVSVQGNAAIYRSLNGELRGWAVKVCGMSTVWLLYICLLRYTSVSWSVSSSIIEVLRSSFRMNKLCTQSKIHAELMRINQQWYDMLLCHRNRLSQASIQELRNTQLHDQLQHLQSKHTEHLQNEYFQTLFRTEID